LRRTKVFHAESHGGDIDHVCRDGQNPQGDDRPDADAHEAVRPGCQQEPGEDERRTGKSRHDEPDEADDDNDDCQRKKHSPMMPRLDAAASFRFAITLTAWTIASTVAPRTFAERGGQVAVVQHSVSFQISVVPQPDEDVVEACKYELTLLDPERRIKGMWVMFERSLDVLRYSHDVDVRTFARRHDMALLFPFHCRSKSETGGDMNVDPPRGLGRALFAGITQLAERSGHPELSSSRLILLGFSGTGSLVARLAAYAPDRVVAVIPTDPGHFDPLGMDTITLPPRVAAIPQLVLSGGADAVSGTERPYAYFRRHFDQGAPWTFVVQNRAPHCCIMNAKALILEWLDAVVVRRITRAAGDYGFIKTEPTDATDCPGQTPPIRSSWCRSPKDTWGGQNWSVTSAAVQRSQRSPQGMMPAGWLPTRAFANEWRAFVTRSEHPVTMPP